MTFLHHMVITKSNRPEMSVTRSKKFIEPAEADLRGGRSVQALQIGCQFAAKKLNELIKKDLGRNNLEPFNRISSPGSIARSVRRSSALLADVEAASGPYARNHVRASLRRQYRDAQC